MKVQETKNKEWFGGGTEEAPLQREGAVLIQERGTVPPAGKEGRKSHALVGLAGELRYLKKAISTP